jgi:hypothetical protein
MLFGMEAGRHVRTLTGHGSANFAFTINLLRTSPLCEIFHRNFLLLRLNVYY